MEYIYTIAIRSNFEDGYNEDGELNQVRRIYRDESLPFELFWGCHEAEYELKCLDMNEIREEYGEDAIAVLVAYPVDCDNAERCAERR